MLKLKQEKRMSDNRKGSVFRRILATDPVWFSTTRSD